MENPSPALPFLNPAVVPAPAPAKTWGKPGPKKGEAPRAKVGRPKGQMIFKEPQQELFLLEYAQCRSISAAAKKVGVSYFCVADLRKRSPSFAQRMLDAERFYVDRLVAEAHRRAVEGVEETKFSQNGAIGSVRKFSDRLLEILLKRYVPEFRETTTTRVEGRVEHAHVVDLPNLIRRLPPERRDQLREILALAASEPAALPPPPDYSEFRPGRQIVDAEVTANADADA